MTEPVSICIPTYQRPVFLKECVVSTFSAQIRPLEILVSDDAHDASVADMLAALAPPSGISVRYMANTAGRGQAANVNNLFKQASHERLILMHDDDFFLEGGIDALVAAWETQGGNVDAVYGRQCIADADGAIDWDATAINDRAYFKLEPSGEQRSPLWAALTQQFPNNSMLIRRSIAAAVGYPPESDVGYHPVDLAFNIAYANRCGRHFIFLHDYVAAYRRSPTSVARSTRRGRQEDGHLIYDWLLTIRPATDDEDAARSALLDRYAPGAVRGHLAFDRTQAAFGILRRHFRTMPISRLGRLRLLTLYAGALMRVNLLQARS